MCNFMCNKCICCRIEVDLHTICIYVAEKKKETLTDYLMTSETLWSYYEEER